MAATGRKPKPAAIKKLEGNPGQRPIPEDFVAASGKANRPAFLPRYAAETWDRICDSMPPGIYTGADVTLLVAYCLAADHMREASIQIQSEGHVVTVQTKDGFVPRRNPWCTVQNDAMAKIATIGSRLGLDPISRESIKAPPEKPKSKFEGLTGINGGKASA